jgi:hypothetical protein
VRNRLVVAGLVSVLVLGGASAATAAAPPVTCGSVLDTDAYLTADLHCPDGTGIYLELDVTLDLRGHRLIGPGADAVGTGNGIGVTIAPVWPSQVINGTITDWPVAIGGNEDKETVPSAVLQDLRLIDNGTAILANQALLTVRRITARSNDIVLDSSGGFDLPSQVTMTDSTVRGNRRGLSCDYSHCDVRRSRFVGNGTAFASTGAGSVGLRDSVFTANRAGFRRVVTVPTDFSAVLKRNTFRYNGDAVVLDDPGAVPGSSVGSTTAVRNAGWGIYAPGVTDLGGNAARRNGRQPQCVGVAC